MKRVPTTTAAPRGDLFTLKWLTALLFLVSILAAASQAAVTLGVDAGYLIDSEEEYLSARAGFTVRSSDSFTHAIELEVGYTEAQEFGAEAELVPVTLNYRFSTVTSGAWGYTLGAGAGFARTTIDGVSINGPIRLRDESFAVQAFAGLTYQATPNLTFNVGAKYIWVDDIHVASTSLEVGDDVAITAGLTFKF